MNVKSPFQIVLLGSFLTALFTLICLILIHFTIMPLHWSLFALPSLLVFGFCFILFYLLVKKLIDKRILLIYRTIRKEKLNTETRESNVSMRSDIISEVSKETQHWAKERRDEISKLKAQEAFRKEFLGNLAHELKTPIFSIQGYILSLLEGGLEDPKVNRDFLQRASKGVDRMTHIIEDLDDITRFESERFQLEIKKFDVVDLADEVIDALRFKADEKSIQVKMNKQYDPVYIKADRKRISQVFTNLISNSLIYGKENGLTEIRFHQMEDVILVEVSDNGPGIDEQHMSRLFERFYRIDKSRARNAGGTGLGLSIAKHIIESHGQDIDVRSTVGVGSTFSFTLNKA